VDAEAGDRTRTVRDPHTKNITEMRHRAESKAHYREVEVDSKSDACGRVVFGNVRKGAAGRAGAKAAGTMSAQGKQAPASRRPQSARAASADAKGDAVRASRDRPPSPNTKVPLKPYEYRYCCVYASSSSMQHVPGVMLVFLYSLA
jgi:hypothetical protein